MPIKVIKRDNKNSGTPELKYNPELGEPKPVYKTFHVQELREQWLEEHEQTVAEQETTQQVARVKHVLLGE